MPRKPHPQKEEIIRLYQEGMSTPKIAEKLNCKIGVPNNIINRAGIARSNKINSRKFTLNHDFFEVIDTEEKAYWLGFIYADGYVTNYGTQKVVSISLSSKDYNHLVKFKEAIGATYDIKTYSGFTKGSPIEYSRLFLTSDKMFDDLSKIGVVERKTLTLKFPDKQMVPDNLMNHFIRGYFDGDGSFSKNASHYKLDYSIKICGTREFLDGITAQVGIGKSLKLLKRHDDTNNNWYLHLGRQKDVLQLADLLYKDATIFLDRKYERYLMMKDRSS